MGRWSSVVAALALSACAARVAATTPPPAAPSAPAAAAVPTARARNAVHDRGAARRRRGRAARGGAGERGARGARARGDSGEPDGALAAVGRLARGAGVTGRGSAAWPRSRCARAFRARSRPRRRSAWTRAPTTSGDGRSADIASNLPVTRYAVYVSPDDVAVVVFGRMEVSLEPFPRRFRPGDACRLRGEIAARYDHARVYLTRPTARSTRRRSSGRAIDSPLTVAGPGVYRVEVMSDGATGPVVLANVPIYVGVDEPRLAHTGRAARRRADRRPGRGGGADARAAERSPARGGAAAAGRRSRAARRRERATPRT